MARSAGETGGPTLRRQRLRYVWLLALPFLLLSKPAPGILLGGALISLLGLGLRAFAAGSIHKDQKLATGGPYRIIRHPLYLGSFLVGFGFALASGRWWLLLVFMLLFLGLYGRTIRAEEATLEALFGPEYWRYRGEVPPFFPRLGGRHDLPRGPGFRSWLFWHNKEWQAALGTLSGYGLLWIRMWLLG